MRLQEKQIESIVKIAKEIFGNDIIVYLFGSRADDTQKGGDIDLFIRSKERIPAESKIKFLSSIYRNVTERKVDLLVADSSKELNKIQSEAMIKGVKLC
jgi:predicted nucleotidyltransferase